MLFRSDDPVAAPRDHEQQRLLGSRDDAGRAVDAVARHHQVHALGRTNLELTSAADHLLDFVGPHAGRVDDMLGVNLERLTRLEVGGNDADNPIVLT